MGANVGKIDAAIRIALGIGLFVVAALVTARPMVSLIAALVGVVMIVTALTRSCPLYMLIGLNTCRPEAPGKPGGR